MGLGWSLNRGEADVTEIGWFDILHGSKELPERNRRDAERLGWVVERRSGHAWGLLKCRKHDDQCRCGRFCRMSVWSTPRSAGNHARQLITRIDGCIHADLIDLERFR